MIKRLPPTLCLGLTAPQFFQPGPRSPAAGWGAPAEQRQCPGAGGGGVGWGVGGVWNERASPLGTVGVGWESAFLASLGNPAHPCRSFCGSG